MYLVVKLIKVWISIQYFPQVKALCSYFTVMPEIPQTVCLQFRPKPTSSGLEMEVKFTISIPTFNAPASTNKVFIFKLTIEDYVKLIVNKLNLNACR